MQQTVKSPRLLRQLATPGHVANFRVDRPVTIFLDVATPTVRSPLLWEGGASGKGIGIAIIDTGIAPHPDLTLPTNRIVAFKDFVANKTTPYDDNGHGTHCAGDAAGNGYASAGKCRGPAYESHLIGIKVLNEIGDGKLSDLVAGIDWCIKNCNKYRIRILSVSLGTHALAPVASDPLARVVQKAWHSGLVVVAAAGNFGPEHGTIASPGIVPEIITVGAVDDCKRCTRADNRKSGKTAKRANVAVANFSGRGPTHEGVAKPDLVAPGTAIVSLRVKGSYLDEVAAENIVDHYYTRMSGTSMATPIVAGIAAQLLQKRPNLTPDEVKNALIRTTYRLAGDKTAAGHGLVNAFRALQIVTQTAD